MKKHIQRSLFLALLGTATCLIPSIKANAQILWSTTGGSAWLGGTNWTGGAEPTGSQIALFGANPTGAATVGINLNGTTNNGSNNQAIGAIHDTTTRTTALTINNSSGSADGTLTLNGTTVYGLSNVILANFAGSTAALTLANGSTRKMDVTVGSGSKTIMTRSGASSTAVGNTITISSKLTGSAALTFLGGGTWNGSTGNAGGVLRLLNTTNTASGGITVGASDGTNNGILQSDSAGTFSNTSGNNITVNPYSSLFLNAPTGASYAQSNTVLFLNGNGNNATLTVNPGALAVPNSKNLTWTGEVNLASDARIAVGAASALTISGNVTGSGALIKGGGNSSTLTLSGTGNTFSGGTQVTTGTVTVASGASLGTGGLTMASASVSTTPTVNLNNASQTLTSLTTNWTPTTGTGTQNLVLSAGHILTLNINSNNTYGAGAVNTLNAVISGTTGKVVKTGTGRLTLTGNGTGATFWGSAAGGGLKVTAGEVRFNPSGTMTISAADTLNGGSFSTVGDTAVTGANATITLGTLVVSDNSGINLDTNVVHTLKFSTSSSLSWTSGKILTITGWRGGYNSTSATKGKILVGAAIGNLSAGQLAQIQFVGPTGLIYTATQITGGEIVPTSTTIGSITTTVASFGPFCNNISNGISVAFTQSGSFTGVYKVQLSNASGTFTADTTTGIIGTGSSSPISATIPAATATGTGYRVRVINSIPATYGSDNGSNITINALPSMGSISGGSSVAVSSTLALSCTPGGGAWSSSNTGIATVDPSTGVVTGVSAGSCTITYTATNSCGSSTATQGITVITSSITTTVGSYGPYCNTTSNAISVAFSSVGTFLSNYKVQMSNASGTFPSDTTTDIIGIGTSSPISATLPISFATGSGYRLRVINADPLTFGSDNGSNITVSALPSMGSISGGSAVDVGSTLSLSCTPGGGTWTSSASGVATVNSSTGVVTGVSVGSATITYTATNSCGSSTATQGVTVNAARSLTTTGASYGPFCNTSGNVISVAFSSTGTFSSLFKVQLSDASGTFTADTTTNIIGSGTTTPISATIPAATAAGTGYRVRVINGLPSPFFGTDNGSNITMVAPVSMGSITGSSTVQTGSSTTLSCTPASGTWSSSNTSIATVNPTTGSVTGVADGSCTITYTASNICGSGTSTLAFTVSNSVIWATSTSGGAWLSTANWTPAAVPTTVQIAQFNANPTGAGNVGINLNGSTNNGANNQAVGAINATSSRALALVVGNSSTSAAGTLTLNGATIGGTSNVVVQNLASSTASLTLQNTSSGGNQLMDVNLPSTATIVAGAGSSSSTAGNSVIITSKLTGSSPLTFLGGGTWNGYTSTGNMGGLLRLGNSGNTFSGGITVGKADSSASGVLQLDNVGAHSNVSGNNILINPNSQLYLASAGTYTTNNINLTLKGRGNNYTTTGLGALVTNTGSFVYTGPISMSDNAIIRSLGSFTITGAVSQTGINSFIAPVGTNSVTPGNAITISNVVSGSGAQDSILGNGTWNGSTGNAGGIVKFAKANTFDGGIVVGRDGAPYSSGILELDTATAINNASGNNITVNPYSQLYLNSVSGDTYNTGNITLNLNGLGTNTFGTPAAGGALVTAVGKSFTWTGPINLASDARIAVLNTATLTLSGNISGTGALIKGGNTLLGNVTLTGTSNSWTGGTQVTAGSLTVASGSSLGNGVLTMAAASTSVAPSIIFNNASQTITSLTSTFPASGSVTHTINLGSGHVMTFNLAADATFGAGANNTLFSILTGAGKVVKNGSTRLTLGGKNNGGTLFITGGLRINAGEIRFNPCGAITMTAPDTLNGGTISTVGDTATTPGVDSIVLGTLALLDNSTINLETSIAHRLKFSASSGISWTSGKVLTINGWQGAFNGTAGTKGRIFVGTNASALTAPQLAQIQFIDGSSLPHDALLLSNGELVAKGFTITTTPASYGPFCAGTSNVISVAFTASPSITGPYKVQISNASGTFTADTTTDIIGSGTASPISATITGSYGVGSGYRVRVINGNTLTFGTDNGSNVNLVALPTPTAISGSSVVIGATTTLTSTPSGGTWSSTNPSIATINPSTGVVYGAGVGTCTISYGVTNVCGTGFVSTTFNVDNHPIITTVSPNTGKPGDTLTLTGQYFNTTPANNIVTFGTTKGLVTSASATVLSVVLDTSASFGPVSVLNTGVNLFGFSKPFTPTYNNAYFINDSLNFKNRVDFSVGTGPNNAAVGDLDGDGKPDFIAANTQAGAGTTLTIYRNVSTPGSISNSSFTSAGSLTSGTGPTNVKIADLDGDGKMDVVCTNTATASISVFRNTSSGIGSISFDAKRDVSTVSSGVIGAQPVVIAIADYDNDGKPDLAVSSAFGSSNTISVIRNTTTTGAAFTGSSFASALTFSAATTPIGICAGDFDGDGLPDIATACSTGNKVSVFLNTGSVGTISFATSSDITVGITPIDVQTGDIDGDGKLDLVVTNAGLASTNVSVLRNTSPSTGTLSFASGVNFATKYSPVGIALADYNGDGKLDMAVSDNGSDSITIYRNTATSGTINSGSFSSRVDIRSASAPSGINACDMDGDTYPDLIVANRSANSISIIRNYPLPKIAAIAGTLSMCESGGTTTLTNDTAGGTWSFSNARATIDAVTGVATGVTAGLDTAFYSVVRGGDTNRVSAVITVNPLPTVPAITGSSSVCPSDSTLLANDTLGGVWGITNPSLATISSVGYVVGIAPGLDTATYLITRLGCSTTVRKPMTINTAPVAGNISGTTTVCVASTTALSSAGGDVGGTWSSSNTAQATVNSSTGVVTGVGAGNPIITYSVTNTCGTATDTALLTVNPLPDPGAITGDTALCTGGDTTQLSNIAVGGSWSSSNTSIATVDATGLVTGVGAGSATISYTSTNSCGTLAATRVVVVNATPGTPASITGFTSVCIGNTTTLSDATVGGTWSSSNPAQATVHPSTGVVTGMAAGSPTITYTVSNICGSNFVTTSVNVLNPPTATLTSAAVPCTGYATTITYSGTTGDTVGYQIDGGSVIDGVITGGTFSFSTGVITAPHTYTLHNVRNAACATTINSDTTITPQAMVWIGGTTGVESNWSTATNWSCNTVPSASDDVIINFPTTHYPVVAASESVNAKNITLASGASITIGSGAILNVKGDVNNNSVIGGAGKLLLNNTTAQNLTGNGSYAALELNNTAGATIAASATTVTITNVLTISGGTLNTNGNLVINSDSASGAARVAPIASGGSINGSAKVVVYIPSGRRVYRFWAHPFTTSEPLSEIGNSIDVTGIGGATNGFTTTVTNSPSAIRYNPLMGNSSLPSDPGWRPFTSANGTPDSNTIHRYQGIRLFIRGAKGQGLDGFPYTPRDTTITMTGPLNQGMQTVTLVKGASTLQDYNMVGNPYASPTDIGTVITNAKIAGNINGNSFYIWNPNLGAAGQFQAITINTASPTPYYVQACISFQVRAAHNNDTLHFEESNKNATPTTNLFKASNEYATLTVLDGNYHPWDILQLRFNNDATDNEDNDYDGGKPNGGELSFYSLSAENNKLAVDGRPYKAGNIIPLGITSNYAQEFIIKADNIAVPEGGKLFLHDKLLKQYVLLQQGTEYRFNITGDKTTQGENRFELSMDPADVKATVAKGLQVSMVPNPATDEVNISFTSGSKNNVAVRLMDISGVSIFNKDLGAQQNGSVTVPLSNFAAGIYMVELTSGDQKVVQRLIKE